MAVKQHRDLARLVYIITDGTFGYSGVYVRITAAEIYRKGEERKKQKCIILFFFFAIIHRNNRVKSKNYQ